ncbi:MAG: hypothetical protein ACWA44_10155 [Thiotrichales bacterium]
MMSALLATYAADQYGIPKPGQRITITDGRNFSGDVSSGDILRMYDAGNRIIREQYLNDNDIYDLRFREAMIKNSRGLDDGGWVFTEKVVDLTGEEIESTLRYFRDPNGNSGQEQAIKENEFWEIVERGDDRFLKMRRTGDDGRPVLASEAIRDVFENREKYLFDCATPMRLLNLKSTLDVIGDTDFNRNSGQLVINSWYDQFDRSHSDGGFDFRTRTAPAGTVTVDGESNVSGELALFDPDQGDKLIPGSVYYFEKPGDTETDQQGWNAVYLGLDETEKYQFWSASFGISDVEFREGTWFPEYGLYTGDYLAAGTAGPNAFRLSRWDYDRSAVV